MIRIPTSQILLAGLLLAAFSTSLSAGSRSSCTPLNPGLAVCNDVPGVRVSFVDATPGALLAIVRLKSRSDFSFVFNVTWDTKETLADYACSRAEELAGASPAPEPLAVTVLGRPAIRYDFAAASDEGFSGRPLMVLFIDTGAGIATFLGNAHEAGVTPEDVYRGAESAARILMIGD